MQSHSSAGNVKQDKPKNKSIFYSMKHVTNDMFNFFKLELH